MLQEVLIDRAGRSGRRAAALVDTALLVGLGPTWRAADETRRLGRPGIIGRKAVYRRIWHEAALAVGAAFSDLGSGYAEISRRERSIRIAQNVTPLDDAVTLQMALDKPLCHRLLAEAHVSIPEHVQFAFDDPRPALQLLHRVGRSVVKPANGTGGGQGVTAGIESARDLLRARLRAGRYDDLLLAERHAHGSLHRLLLLEGKLLDVIVDRPPHVVGDGRSTLEKLIRAENRKRRDAQGEAGLELLELDMNTALTLRGAGISLRSIPPEGREVPVKSVTNDGGLEDSHTYRGGVHHEVLGEAVAAAGAVGLRLAGVDVIASSIDRPLAETGGVVIEVNGTPGLHRHYHVADRDAATPVAIEILDHMLG